MFFGIVVFMYYDDHAPPHFHILYEGEEALVDFDGAVQRGHVTSRVSKLIREWAELHRGELEENWLRARDSMGLNWIEPLK